MSMNCIRLCCMTLGLTEKRYYSGELLVWCSDKTPFPLRPCQMRSEITFRRCISQGSVLEIGTLDILRRKRFIYYEELGASQVVGRVGGETLSTASRSDFL